MHKRQLAEKTLAFYFAKPKDFIYTAGQFGEINLPVPNGEHDEDYVRSFSFASAPFEEILMIVTRIRQSVFKQSLAKLEIGQTTKLDGPYGIFTLSDDNKTSVLIANGIGITAIRSMVMQAYHENRPSQLVVLYGYYNGQELFVDELKDITAQFNQLTFLSILIDDKNEGQPGLVPTDWLNSQLSNLVTARYYLCGGISKVQSTRRYLLENSVAAADILLDEFSGY